MKTLPTLLLLVGVSLMAHGTFAAKPGGEPLLPPTANALSYVGPGDAASVLQGARPRRAARKRGGRF